MQKVAKEKKTGAEMFFANPMIRKLTRIEEKSEDCATYASIANKCTFFMAMILVGVLLMIGLQAINPATYTLDDGSVVTISDANLIAPYGPICLDGLGPIGDDCHSRDEYLDIDSVMPFYKLSQVLIRDLADSKK